ncbi:MAG TPA: precorrin-6y C5,15-methyltransferase (decarboxylating) subunit CbiE [Nitrospirota bacterium]|nr:precorrin-6y C5,15-methyltransferase (decarboxylating) subunit CbiE [Nitrospirota bacterium]
MIHVIGVGIEGVRSLSIESLEKVGKAKLVMGSERHLKQLPEVPEPRKYSLKADLFKMVDVIKKKKKSDVVVLASGDPNLYGITNYLFKNFGREDITITPAVSSMQWAFALAKETWEDAEIVSAHGRGADDVIKAALMRDKVGVFTDEKNSPDKIASALIKSGVGERRVFVCENLGLDNPKLFEGSLQDTAQHRFSPMNVMLIKNEHAAEPEARAYTKTIGIPDFQFLHREGMITKAEVRAIALSKLRPERGNIMWDIGAGCGSVSIEAEPMVAPGKVFAVEKDLRQLSFLKKNIGRFSASGVEPITGEAPGALKPLPDPDIVFVGGSSGHLTEILHYIDERLKRGGRLVANVVTVENLGEVLDFMKSCGYAFEITSVSVSRSKELSQRHFMVAGNPVNIIMGIKT